VRRWRVVISHFIVVQAGLRGVYAVRCDSTIQGQTIVCIDTAALSERWCGKRDGVAVEPGWCYGLYRPTSECG